MKKLLSTLIIFLLILETLLIFPIKADSSSYPQYSNLSNTTAIGNSTSTLSSYWTDSNNTLSKYVIQTNTTGTDANSTFQSFTSPWANATILLPAFGVVQWCVYANDSIGNWNSTNLQYLVITPVFNITSAYMNGTRFNPTSKININGQIDYNGTSIPATSNVTVYAGLTARPTYILGSTSDMNATGGFNFNATLPSYIGILNYTIYTTQIGFIITNGGSNYNTPVVIFSGGGGSGMTATAGVVNHHIIDIKLTNSGSGYTSAPSVAFSDPNPSAHGAAATAFFNQGICGQNKTIAPIVDQLNVVMSVNSTNPVGLIDSIAATVSATYASDSTPVTWANLGFSVNRSLTYYSQTNFTDTAKASGTTEIYTINNANETIYGLNTIFTSNILTVMWTNVGTAIIQISQILQNTTRTGINQNISTAYKVQYNINNGTGIINCNTGNIVVSGSTISVINGWANFTSTSATVGLATYTLNSVNCNGITVFSQIPADPKYVFDNLQVYFLASDSTPINGEPVIISWIVLREYDGTVSTNITLDVTKDLAYLANNLTALSTTDIGTEETHSYSTNNIKDNTYNITSYTVVLPLTLTWHTVGSAGTGSGNNNQTPAPTSSEIANISPPLQDQLEMSPYAMWGIIAVVIIIIVATVYGQESSKRKSAGHILKGKDNKIWQS